MLIKICICLDISRYVFATLSYEIEIPARPRIPSLLGSVTDDVKPVKPSERVLTLSGWGSSQGMTLSSHVLRLVSGIREVFQE